MEFSYFQHFSFILCSITYFKIFIRHFLSYHHDQDFQDRLLQGRNYNQYWAHRDSLCPIRTLLEYSLARGAPLFIHGDDSPLRRYWFRRPPARGFEPGRCQNIRDEEFSLHLQKEIKQIKVTGNAIKYATFTLKMYCI